MYSVEFSKLAERKFKKLTIEKKIQVKKVVEILEKDPFDKKLKTHKLSGELEGVYSTRVNFKDRLLFIIVIKNQIVVTDIGNHDDAY